MTAASREDDARSRPVRTPGTEALGSAEGSAGAWEAEWGEASEEVWAVEWEGESDSGNESEDGQGVREDGRTDGDRAAPPGGEGVD